MFHVGQKVVCVDASAQDVDGRRRLRDREVYTIKEVVLADYATAGPYGRDLICVHLVEVKRPDGVPYSARRFRPAVERKTDISIFQAMLNPKHEQVSA